MIGRPETLSAEIPENVCGKRQGGKGEKWEKARHQRGGSGWFIHFLIFFLILFVNINKKGFL